MFFWNFRIIKRPMREKNIDVLVQYSSTSVVFSDEILTDEIESVMAEN